MLSVDTRQGTTARGHLSFEAWLPSSSNTYSLLQINLGNNSISRLEVVSAINSFNTSSFMYIYSFTACFQKYNPKVYMGAVQSVADRWNLDYQNGQNNGLPNMDPDGQKSGSWP